MRHRTAAVLAAAAWLCAAPASAGATQGSRVDFDLGLTTSAAAAPSGLSMSIVFHQPGDRDAKPPALDSAVVHLPDGLRYDTTTVPECTASDTELHVLGADACPADTQLALGTFSAVTGLGPPVDPLPGDDHVFNGPNQIIEVITAPGTPLSPGFDRLTIQGTTVTAHPPAAPGGPPDGRTAIRSIAFKIPVRTAGSRSLVTTPPDCPPEGHWTATGTFGFADGSSETVSSAMPCTAPPASPGAVRVDPPQRRVAARRCGRTSASSHRRNHRRRSSSRRTRSARRGAAGARGRATSATARRRPTTSACHA